MSTRKTNNIDFLTLVKERRKEIGKTQKDFATLLGVSQSSYAQLESGKRSARFHEFKALADYLGIPFLVEPDPPPLEMSLQEREYLLEQIKTSLEAVTVPDLKIIKDLIDGFVLLREKRMKSLNMVIEKIEQFVKKRPKS